MARKKKEDLGTAFIGVLLDESGSMSGARSDTIGGVNTFVGELKKTLKGRTTHFNLVKFGGAIPMERVFVGKQISEVPMITEDHYRPTGNTPLIDAAVKMIKALDDQRKKAGGGTVTLMIQTDGHENASREHTGAELKALVEAKTAEGWQFMFVGADFDAYGVAASYGFNQGSTANYVKGMETQMFRSVASNTATYAATGNAATSTFSVGQKAAMGDNTVSPSIDLGNA